MGIPSEHDPVELALAFAQQLGGQGLPPRAGEKLRGDTQMSRADREQIGGAFRRTLASPKLTNGQRNRVRELLEAVTSRDPELAVIIDALEPAPPPADAPAHIGIDQSATARSTPGDRPPPPPMHAQTPTDMATSSGRNRREVPDQRRWPYVALAVTVAAAFAGVSYLAWTNHQSGVAWQQRAAAAQADVDRLTRANESFEADLDELGESLRRSEADVALLEKRTSRAADEKARAEDEREMAHAYAERITEVVVAYDDVAEWFSACRSEQSALTTMVVDFEDYYFAGQTHLIATQINRAADTCMTAERHLSDLRSYVHALNQ